MRLALALALLSLSAALAANVPEVRSFGFSSDLRFYVFERWWTADGSGFPFRELYVLNARTGARVAALKLGGEHWAGRAGELERTVTRERKRWLARYKVDGSRLGAVVYHSPTRPPLTPEQRKVPAPLTLAFGGKPLRVELRLTASSVPCSLPGRSGVSARLNVNGHLLRPDAQLVTWPYCASLYRLEEVRVFGDRVAVLLRAFLPGFEGDDAMPLVALGRWR